MSPIRCPQCGAWNEPLLHGGICHACLAPLPVPVELVAPEANDGKPHVVKVAGVDAPVLVAGDGYFIGKMTKKKAADEPALQ